MSLQEAKEIFGTLIFGGFFGSLALLYIAYIFAKITYKLAHRKSVQKTHRSAQKVEIIYNIGDTKNMTLQEIQAIKRQMRREILENV